LDVRTPLSTAASLALMAKSPRRGRGFWFSLAIDLLWPFMAVFTKVRMQGREHLPKDGGVVVASNHLSQADPVTVTMFCLGSKRLPRYLAKASLWKIPVIRRVLAGGKHVPVHRGTTQASDAFRSAVEAAESGECVIFFPEGGLSDDADLWPSDKVKNGVARVALDAGVPVIPLANWGTHKLLPAKGKFPRLLPRKRIDLVAGPPVDLSDLTDAPRTRETYDAATKRIMAAVTALLAELREEPTP
jgi:1-acyl-sn-glycerol-3-phosphate acyltransferase